MNQSQSEWITQIVADFEECHWSDETTLVLPKRGVRISFPATLLERTADSQSVERAQLASALLDQLRLIETRDYRRHSISFTAANTTVTSPL